MFPTFSSLSAPAVWGEAGRNALKLSSIMSGSMGEAGIYLRRDAGQPDVLVGLVTAGQGLRIAVRHPDRRTRRGYLVSTWVQGEHLWNAYLDDDVETRLLGADPDPARACALITGVEA